MHINLKLNVIFLFHLTLAACANVSSSNEPEINRPIALLGSVQGAPTELNGCGLFTWAKMPERKLVFYTNSSGTDSRLTLDGEQKTLKRQSSSGHAVGGLLVRQVYSAQDVRVELDLAGSQYEALQNGGIYKNSLLKIAYNKMDIIVPTVVIYSCQ